MIALEPIKWQPEPGEFRGEIGASVRLSAGRWQELGAQFSPQDDGNGESPGLAVGAIGTSEGELPFAVLDYGEDTTYLLVPTADRRERRTSAVLSAFRDRDLIAEDEIVDTTIGVEEASTRSDLADRLDSIEETLLALATASAERRAASVPHARVVDVFGSGRSYGWQRILADESRRRILSAGATATGLGDSRLLTGMIQHFNCDGYVQFRPDFGDHLMVILRLDRDWLQSVGGHLHDPESHDEAVHVALEILEEAAQ